jgi:hypothetical protein
MEQAHMVGPRLSDADFFAKIDVSRPGLEGIPEAISEGNFGAARRILASEVRRTLQPERFFRMQRPFRGEHFMRPGESAEEAAERIMRGELISCGTPYHFAGEVDWFSNPTFNQYKEWTWQLSRHPEWGILAERYRQTGDERYAQAFVRFFESWVHQAVVPEDAPGGDTLCWRTIETGIRMGGVWQWALHSFYRSPAFTDDVLIDWYKSVWEHGWRLRNFHRTGNWLIMEMNGLAQVAILYPQFKEAPAWQEYAFAKMVDELEEQVYPDGFQVELSTNYHQVDIRNYQWLIDVCRAYDVPVPPQFTATLERMHTVNVLLMMPDGRLPDLNDGIWASVAPMMKSAVSDYPQRLDFAWAGSGGEKGKPPEVTSHAFTYAGYYVMRTGWQRDALWALFDGGPFGYGHQHEDKLNIILHAYGRLLLTEGGNYAYDDSEMRRYVLSTRAHNTIRVDGQDQARHVHYDRSLFDVANPAGATWRFADAYDVAHAVYDEGYGPDATRCVRHERKVIMLKMPPAGLGPCLIVIDRLHPLDGSAHHFQSLWHFSGETVNREGRSIRGVDAGQPNLAIIPSALPGLTATVVQGQESPEWQGWKTIKLHQQGEYAPAPVAVHDWTAGQPARVVTVLYPTRAGETCPVIAVEASVNPAARSISLTLADGSVVGLNEADFAF